MRAASSPDGINWTNNPLPQNSTWIGLAYGNNNFVAVSGINGTLTANLLVPGPPSIVLTNPSAGQTWNAGSGITLSATPSVSGATVAQVAYYNGSTLIASVTQSPYSYTWTTATPGSYSISAVVTDSVGHTASSDTVNISVSNGMCISITSPANNAQLTGKSLTLSASVNSNGSTVAQVAYYNGSALMATTNQAPYTIVLPDAESGVYVLTAQVTNADGQVVVSAPVNVTLTEEGAGGGGSTGSGGEVLYDIHTDQLNTPRMITDQGGNVVWQWDNQDPFGNNIPNQDPNGTGNQFVFNLRFPGQYFDIETGTHYNYFRDYDPSTGRYAESDPIGLYGRQFSTYAYVVNSPLKYVDSRGLQQSMATMSLPGAQMSMGSVGGLANYASATSGNPFVPSAASIDDGSTAQFANAMVAYDDGVMMLMGGEGVFVAGKAMCSISPKRWYSAYKLVWHVYKGVNHAIGPEEMVIDESLDSQTMIMWKIFENDIKAASTPAIPGAPPFVQF